MPYRSDMQVQFYLGAFELDLTLPGIRRTILSSRSRHSGPLEPQRGQERPCQADTQRQWDVISTSRRSGLGLGLGPIYVPLSQRPRGLHAAKLPECLRRLIAMRSAYYFQISNCCRSWWPANNAIAVMWRAGSGTFQLFSDGEVGSVAGGDVSYLGRPRAKQASLSSIHEMMRMFLH
jgi:hypothetical protein